MNEVAEARGLGVGIESERLGQYRTGDIRHCYVDVSRARELLGFASSVSLEDGMRELIGRLQGQEADDLVDQATRELVARGLAR